MKKKIVISSKFDIERYTRWLNTGITIEQLTKITQNQYSHNSLLAMRRDWMHFHTFCSNTQRTALPASVLTVRHFVTETESKTKFATLKRYVVSISNIHQILGYVDPTANREISLLIQTCKLRKLGDEKTTNPLTRVHLEQLHHQLINQTDPVSIRDLSLYFLMFECALKRSELRDLSRNQITYDSTGNISLIELDGNSYKLSNKCSDCLLKWLNLIPDDYPAVFRAIDKHGNIGQVKLNDSSIFRILQKASIRLGLPQNLHFSGQSARVGAVQELHQQGYKVKDIQQFGRWNSPVMPNHYLGQYRQAELGKVVFKTFKLLT